MLENGVFTDRAMFYLPSVACTCIHPIVEMLVFVYRLMFYLMNMIEDFGLPSMRSFSIPRDLLSSLVQVCVLSSCVCVCLSVHVANLFQNYHDV